VTRILVNAQNPPIPFGLRVSLELKTQVWTNYEQSDRHAAP